MSVTVSTRAALVAAVVITVAGCAVTAAHPSSQPTTKPPAPLTATSAPAAQATVPAASPIRGPIVYDTSKLGMSFDLPLTITLPDGWIPLAPPMFGPDGSFGTVKTGTPPDDTTQWWGFGFNLVDGASVADPEDIAKPSDVTKMPWPSSYIDYLVALPGVVVEKGPAPTTVDGVEARRVVVQTPPMHPTIFLKGDYAWLGGGSTGIDGAFGRLVIELTVDGKRVLIEYDDAPEHFDEHLPTVDDMIASIAFTK